MAPLLEGHRHFTPILGKKIKQHITKSRTPQIWGARKFSQDSVLLWVLLSLIHPHAQYLDPLLSNKQDIGILQCLIFAEQMRVHLSGRKQSCLQPLSICRKEPKNGALRSGQHLHLLHPSKKTHTALYAVNLLFSVAQRYFRWNGDTWRMFILSWKPGEQRYLSHLSHLRSTLLCKHGSLACKTFFKNVFLGHALPSGGGTVHPHPQGRADSTAMLHGM